MITGTSSTSTALVMSMLVREARSAVWSTGSVVVTSTILAHRDDQPRPGLGRRRRACQDSFQPSSRTQGGAPNMPDARVRTPQNLDRNLALDLVRVTEAAAMAAGRWVGRGDKEGGDGAAVDAMRKLINSVPMRGVVVIGEGEKDNAPMLYNGERVGDGTGPEVDVAVDPIDGTTLTAKGMSNAVAVLAVAPRGSMYDPSAVFYMEKLVTGPEAAEVVDIRYPVSENIHQVAKAKGTTTPAPPAAVLARRPP